MSAPVDAIICLADQIKYYELAERLAEQWQIPFYKTDKTAHADGLFLIIDQQVKLQQGGKKAPGAVLVDFVSGSVAHRRKFGGGNGQSIAKAVGVTGSYQPSVVDATAGLGGDAFVLATLGCKVTMMERHPVVFELLDDGLKRAQQAPEIDDIIERLSLQQGAAQTLLKNYAKDSVDVVYLDPMFPHSESKAQVKKEMQLFRQLVGFDLDEDELWQAADNAARCRVVVKRPRKAPFLAEQAPSYSLEGKANRFDIYAKSKVAAAEPE